MNLAVTAATVAGAAFTGLAQASVTSGATTTYYLYAADFTGTTGANGIDVFDPTFTNVSSTTFAGKFVDPNAVAGFDPYNIALLNGNLYVAYAKPSGHRDAPGGYIDEFSTAGDFIKRIYTDTTGTNLTGPWGWRSRRRASARSAATCWSATSATPRPRHPTGRSSPST